MLSAPTMDANKTRHMGMVMNATDVAKSAKASHEANEKSPKTLMAMLVGRPTNLEAAKYHHELPDLKMHKGFAKEVKPELKHFKAEIIRRYLAHGLHYGWKEPRPSQWPLSKCLQWLVAHYIDYEKDLSIMVLDYVCILTSLAFLNRCACCSKVSCSPCFMFSKSFATFVAIAMSCTFALK